MDSNRGNWHYIFFDLIELNNRLEQLKVDAIVLDSDKLASFLPINPQTASAVHAVQ